ncbi:MAG: preprotein translocase subunit YajC [Bacteroidetes bacterium]|nr:preprotein translocase subunit YajC [Bacteroidota bacterium]
MQLLDIFLQGKGNDIQSTVIFMGLMIIVFYFFMIRPQQKKMNNQKKFLEGLKKGDLVVTTGGIHGKVEAFDGGSTLIINSEGTRLKVEKSAISSELSAPLNKA